MFLDWLLASFHHLAVFSLAAILSAEIFLTLGPIDDRMALRLARVDAWFGIMAALALAAGLMRLAFGAKGADYYLAQHLLLAQDGAVRRRRGDLDRADLFLSRLAAPGPRRRLVPPPGARDRPAAPGALRRSGTVCADPALRRGDGPRLRDIRLGDRSWERSG